MITIRNDKLEAQVTPWRAELVALRGKGGEDFLWNGDPDVWKGHSPILFPIVGMVPDNQVKIGGRLHTLYQHGFAPRIEFDALEASEDTCTFRLQANDATRAAYPFEFCLDVRYALSELTLTIDADVTNLSDASMPYSFGLHPGFCWPLPGAGPREDHFLEFEQQEQAAIRRPKDGLLDPERFPTPISGNRLQLHDGLFEQGAIIFDEICSQRVRFGSNAGPHLDIEWRNLPHLGIWSQPAANYLCVEPWQGFPAPEGFDEELADKPGILHLSPKQSEQFGMSITVVEKPLRDAIKL